MGSRMTTARLTGLFYLGLAISGMVGFLMVRSRLYVAGDAAATAANLMAHPSLARSGIAADMTIAVTQTLAALWFFRLFQKINGFAAGALAAFGFVNAIMILFGVACTATALNVSITGGAAAAVQVLYALSGNAWGVGALFFGLWLIPMGYLVYTCGDMPRALGVVLTVGGFGYLVSAYVTYLWPGAPDVVNGVLTGIPSVGEFWIIGYLLIFGRHADGEATAQA